VRDDSPGEQDVGYVAAKSLLAAGKGATALFCASDSIARGAMEAIGAAGLRIPEDVSIVGFGDWPEAAAMSPPLTSVFLYPEQVGRRLAEMVLRRIADPDAPLQSAMLPARLVKRDSCGKAACHAGLGR
jgi:LacI family transcriptional regulator